MDGGLEGDTADPVGVIVHWARRHSQDGRGIGAFL